MAVAGKVACTPKGDWVNGTAYEVLDIVKHDGASWMSKVDNNSQEPSDTALNWLQLAKDGVDGTDGTDGTNGIDGVDGSLWYRGTAVSGKISTPAAFNTGITEAHTNDNYLNTNEGAIYHCVTPGDESTATWVYDMTLTGGGSSEPTWSEVQGKPFTNIGDGLEVVDVGGVPTLTSNGGALKIGDVSGASISSNMTEVSLTWSDPADIVVDGTTLAAWEGTLVVRKAGSAPANRNDGTVIVDNKVRNQYSVNALTDNTVEYGTTYYYRFFPYTTNGAYTTGSALAVTPGRINIEHVPVQSGTLTYDGTEKTASFAYYDSDKMTVSGNTGTNAGSYTAIFTPKEGYCWTDGTITGKEVSWTIGNAVIDTLPHITSALIYTGSEITPTWADYDPDELTMGGDEAGTNVGSYSTDFTPKTNYEWWDGTRSTKSVNWAIVYESIEHVPVQTGSLTYDGTAQSPTWLYFDSTKMTKTETAQTDAGTYSTTFTPITGYSWPDSTTEAKIINWTITKATLTIPTMNAYDLTYDGSSKSVTFSNFDSNTMTKSGDSATDAGSHTATIGIIDDDNYEWTDHTTADQTYSWTISKASLAIPTQSTTTPLVYSGSAQTGSFNDYDSDTMTVSGNSATDAGTHTATFALKDTDNYQWSGGSISDQDVDWVINKADQTITPQSASVTLDGSNPTATLGISQTGDGAITAESSDPSVATASVSGLVCTISNVNNTNGIATITLRAAATTNYKAASATIEVTASFSILYGFKVDSSVSDPTTAVSYQVTYNGRQVDNYSYTPAAMNFSTGVFNPGDWNLADDFFIPRPCMVKYDGTVDYYLDVNDYTKKEDGTASDVANLAYGGNAMMEWGRDGQKIWYAVIPDSSDATKYTVLIANTQIDSNFHCWPFYDANDRQIDHFYTAIYEGYVNNNVLRSISGVKPTSNTTGANEITYAKANNRNNGHEWYITQYADRVLINNLLVLISKSLDTQSKFGTGNYTGGSSTSNLLTQGLANDKGLFYGTNGNEVVKVFGMENYFADRWERCAGYSLDSGVIKYKMTYGTADGSAGTGFVESDSAPSGYLTGPSIATNLRSSYVTKQTAYANGAILPSAFGGSSSTYYCDAVWSSSGVRFGLVGGCCYFGAACGAFALPVSAALSHAYWNNGASLSLKPLAA